MAANGFEPVIGLEVHAQLLTASKIFCGCQVSYGSPPNSNTCPVCLGLPGALPTLNRQAVELGLRTILALGGEVRARSEFARKSYFYPDLPKGFQISQYDRPLGVGGSLAYSTPDGEASECHLSRIHLEEDAGKSLHPEGVATDTRVDLNRCGVPLVEIVSEPELRTPAQARAYLEKLKLLLQYTGVCTGDMEKGHLRCDVNISLRKRGTKSPGVRTEIKNLNSFRAVERALRYEIDRQAAILLQGDEVSPATLLWNEARQEAEIMRTKEESTDYRYFPEPDLNELVVSEDWVRRVRDTMPELADERRQRLLVEYRIREYDSAVLTASKELADYYEELMTEFDDAQAAANWVVNELPAAVSDLCVGLGDFPIRPYHAAELLKQVARGRISGKMAKGVFMEMRDAANRMIAGEADIDDGDLDPVAIIERHDLSLIDDEDYLASVVDDIISSQTEQVARYRGGKTALLGHFVGLVMKATDGRAEPAAVNRLLIDRLEN